MLTFCSPDDAIRRIFLKVHPHSQTNPCPKPPTFELPNTNRKWITVTAFRKQFPEFMPLVSVWKFNNADMKYGIALRFNISGCACFMTMSWFNATLYATMWLHCASKLRYLVVSELRNCSFNANKKLKFWHMLARPTLKTLFYFIQTHTQNVHGG